MSEGLRSYPKVWNLGHPQIDELLHDEVIVEEKVDGSQFSFGVQGGELLCRSKGKQILLDAPDSLFVKAVETAKEIAPLLVDGWTYRAEYLKKPRHNGLAYDRVPMKHLALFDINTGEERYLSWDEKAEEARRIGLEVVPLVYGGWINSPEQVREFMGRTSFLGGQPIEGLVVKNYARFGRDGKALMGKHVSEQFKEVQKKHWTNDHPKNGDIIERICSEYRTEARWQKAVQHMRERGELEGSPRDIGALIKEVQSDIDAECADEIKATLYKWAVKQVKRQVVRGLPEWYKQRLIEAQFRRDGVEE
jgi:hypothetical protein